MRLSRMIPSAAAGAALLAVVAVTTAVGASGEPVFADLSGRQVRVSDRPREVVLLNFWATWCGPCRAEMPELQAIHAEMAGDEVRVLGAAANGRDEAELVRRVMAERGATYETWVWVSAGDMRHYGVGPGIPATVLIDRAGQVRHRFQGIVTAETLRPLLRALLQEPKPAASR